MQREIWMRNNSLILPMTPIAKLLVHDSSSTQEYFSALLLDVPLESTFSTNYWRRADISMLEVVAVCRGDDD